MEMRKFVGTSLEDVADEFSKMVEEEDTNHLEFLKANSITDREEPDYWEKRLKSETKIVYERVYSKILMVMKNLSQYEELLKKRFPWSRPIIRITRVSSFFAGISPGPQNPIPRNVEWLIDPKKMSIQKKVYSKYTNCN